MPRRSAAAEAAALRLGELGESGPTELPPPFAALEGRSAPAHAEAAALRWREQHPGEPR
jgi:hypothetical protein